jgi:hypothetical protein
VVCALTTRRRVLAIKLTGPQQGRISPQILWNPMVHYPFRRAHQLSLSRARSIRPTLPSYSLKTPHFHIILATTPKSFTWSLSVRFPYQNSVSIPLIHHTCHMPSPSHTHRFYHPSGISYKSSVSTGIKIKCVVRLVDML